MKVYIGAENIISPLGFSAKQNFSNALLGKTGLQKFEKPYDKIDRLTASIITDYPDQLNSKIEWMINNSIQGSLEDIVQGFSGTWLLVLSTTKGEVEFLKNGDIENARPSRLLQKIQETLPFITAGKVISNACVSGLTATIYAADQIKAGNFDHAIVVGADTVSEFTVRGFTSFYALDDDPCKPFDSNRKGLNLGEAAASVILSRKDIFKNSSVEYLTGSTSNDANHISGPSRTGEGLFRSISRTMQSAGVTPEEIDYVSAHGTGTRYNDDMESEALTRAALHNTPTNSLKGFYGHSLGASSLVELAMAMQSMRQNAILKSMGCDEAGTNKPLNVAVENIYGPVNHVIKTASGFGGSNATIILKKYTE